MRHPRVLVVTAALVLVAAACGSASDDDTLATPATVTPVPAATAAPVASTASSATTPIDPAGESSEPTPTTGAPGPIAEGWTVTEIGVGIKPVLAIDSSGSPAIAFLTEKLGDGYVAYAAAGDGWAADRFVEGYFYGPIGLDFDPQDNPNVVWHDHQSDTFDQNLGSLVHAVRRDGTWASTDGTDDGHDGWDSTLVIGSDGVVRAAGIDPAQFGREDGIEYYELLGDTFVVEAIDSGPIAYEFNVALDVDEVGRPALSYYDTEAESLRFARRDDTGWNIVTVDEGESGKYSSLILDTEGLAHIAYFHQTGTSTGMVRYAVEDASGAWETEDVGTLSEVRTGFTGARRITSIALGSDGSPTIAFSDEGGIYTATRRAGDWDVTAVLMAGSRPLGQLVSFALAPDGTAHLAYFEVTSASPLAGVVYYATAAAA